MDKYQVECPRCGIYPVSEDYFFDLIDKDLAADVKRKLNIGIWSVKIKFDEGCHNCQDKGKSKGKIIFIRKIKPF